MSDDPHTIIVDGPYKCHIDGRHNGPEDVSIGGRNEAEFTACGKMDGFCFNPCCDRCNVRLESDLNELHRWKRCVKTPGGRKAKQIRGQLE